MSKGFRYASAPIGWQGQPLDFSGSNGLNIYALDALQRYIYGTRYLTWDGKVYKHSKAGATLDPDLGAKAYATQNLAYVTFAAGQEAAIGDTKVICTFGAADGLANSGLVVEDELAGGECVIFSNTVVTQRRGIIGNTGIPSTAAVTLYLDNPLQAAITAATSFIEAMASEFLDVRNSQDAFKS